MLSDDRPTDPAWLPIFSKKEHFMGNAFGMIPGLETDEWSNDACRGYVSIESQIDFCKYELKGGSCRVFKDKGYSGKNTDRPEFQKLLGEIRKGKVRRVIVYKLDRISRSILDFATMMELFQEYDVEFVSSTEIGRASCRERV